MKYIFFIIVSVLVLFLIALILTPFIYIFNILVELIIDKLDDWFYRR